MTEFASNRNTTKETLYASRGIIYDVDGKPLAKNTNSYKIIAILSPSRTTDMENPMHVVDKEQTATKICNVVASTDENKTKCQSDLKSYFGQNLYQVELGIWGKISEDERQALLQENLPGKIMFTINNTRFIGSSTLGTVSITFLAERNLLIQPIIILFMCFCLLVEK